MSENIENMARAEKAEESVPFSKVDRPRVYVRKGLIQKLVRLGIKDEVGPVATIVNDVLDHYISTSQARVVNLGDLAAVEQDLSARLRELTIAQLEIAKILTEVGAAAEYNGAVKCLYGLLADAKGRGKGGTK